MIDDSPRAASSQWSRAQLFGPKSYSSLVSGEKVDNQKSENLGSELTQPRKLEGPQVNDLINKNVIFSSYFKKKSN